MLSLSESTHAYDRAGNLTEMENSEKVNEFIRNLFLIRKGHAKLLCGSSFELLVKYVMGSPTDVDILYIPPDICALPLNVSAPHTFQGKTLVINTKSTHPGFASLFSPDCKRLYCKQARILDGHCATALR